MAYGFNIRAIIKVIIKNILQPKRLLVILYINLKKLYNYLVKLEII